jgi:hypothetical protein
MHNVFTIFAGIISKMLDNIDLYTGEKVDIPYLHVPSDRSCIIANCIKHYIYNFGDEEIKQIPQAVNKSNVTNSSTILFHSGNLSVVKPAIIKALTKLKSDILATSTNQRVPVDGTLRG